MPKIGLPVELNDYRPVALTSHIIKTLERFLVRRMKLQVAEELEPLQFAYQEHLGAEDAVLYLLHQAYSYLGVPSYVLIAFLFTLYRSDCRYNSESCHIQKYSNDTAVVACVSGGQQGVYRDLVETFTDVSKKNLPSSEHHQD